MPSVSASAFAADVFKTRRVRLRHLIDHGFAGKQIAFSRAIDRQPDYVSRCLSGKKKIGEAFARMVEARIALPHGLLDTPLTDPAGDLPMTTHCHIDRIDTLFDARFNQGQPPRSLEYKHGFRAGLERAAGFYLRKNPHAPGTTASDAWYAGFDAGQAAWQLDAARDAA